MLRHNLFSLYKFLRKTRIRLYGDTVASLSTCSFWSCFVRTSTEQWPNGKDAIFKKFWNCKIFIMPPFATLLRSTHRPRIWWILYSTHWVCQICGCKPWAISMKIYWLKCAVFKPSINHYFSVQHNKMRKNLCSCTLAYTFITGFWWSITRLSKIYAGTWNWKFVSRTNPHETGMEKLMRLQH